MWLLWGARAVTRRESAVHAARVRWDRAAYAAAWAACMPTRVTQCSECGACRTWGGIERAHREGWRWRRGVRGVRWLCPTCASLAERSHAEIASAVQRERARYAARRAMRRPAK